MLQVLYEDNHLIAVYKPAGVLIQAGDRKSGNLMDVVKEYLRQKYNKSGNVFLGLVHRLDRSVCGIVVFAKTSKGASRLSEQFRNRQVKKTYTAILEGSLKPERGNLIHYIKKDEFKLIALISEKELPDYTYSELNYQVVKKTKKYSLVKINLKTGRFNQIRAQFSHIGHPVVGDKLYGAKSKMIDGAIALCATEIEFKTATGEEVINIKSDYPVEWDTILKPLHKN